MSFTEAAQLNINKQYMCSSSHQQVSATPNQPWRSECKLLDSCYSMSWASSKITPVILICASVVQMTTHFTAFTRCNSSPQKLTSMHRSTMAMHSHLGRQTWQLQAHLTGHSSGQLHVAPKPGKREWRCMRLLCTLTFLHTWDWTL